MALRHEAQVRILLGLRRKTGKAGDGAALAGIATHTRQLKRDHRLAFPTSVQTARGGLMGEDMTEEEWNKAHDLTATCPQCGRAMKDDGRRVCSWACWHKTPEEER